ncbi:MAG: hypothetical protein IJ592_04535, partial [Candidatus Methanomethylophilaceae archaeon]|nr:hypothetical protein [Candidatus Methanomethylophilaceae archaeon]
IKEKYKDGFPETQEVAGTMEDLIDEFGGTSSFFVTCVPAHRVEVCKRLGLSAATLPEVSGDVSETQIGIKELKEANYIMKLGSISAGRKEEW